MTARYRDSLRAAETLVSRFATVVDSRNGATFSTFLSGGRTEPISFSELSVRSRSYAERYREMGVKAGDLIIIILQHTPHLFYSYLGAILAGAVPSFMPFPSPKQRADIYWRDHNALFARIAPRLIVTYAENLASAKEVTAGFSIPTLIAQDGILGTAASAALESAGSNSVACLQHSSGTTGLKKGVMLTHRAILDQVDTYSRAIGLGPDDVIGSWLPLYHDMGFIACFMTSVLMGTHLIALDPFEWVMRPTQLLDAIQKYRATFIWLPNFAFSHIANGARESASWDLSSMRAFINCSEPCKVATFDRFLQRFGECGVTREKLQVCYAMAENVFAVTQTPSGEMAKTFLPSEPGRTLPLLSCGQPVDGVELEIRDPEDRPLVDATVGEVCLRSPFMFDGYYKLPEKTAERLRDGWYHTGDLGLMHDGELYITGRMDDMLVINGRNYYAHEIESIVSDISGTLPGRNVAIGIDDRLTDSTVVVVLVECRPEAVDSEVALEVRRRVLETLGLAIHSVVPVGQGELVKTTSGKISRTKNRELYLGGTLLPRGGTGVP